MTAAVTQKTLSNIGLAEEIAACQNRSELFNLFDKFVAGYGAVASFVSVINGAPAQADESFRSLHCTYPKPLIDYYIDNECVRHDVFLRDALRRDYPVHFLKVFGSVKLEDVMKDLTRMMREHGLIDGLSMHVSDRPGRVLYVSIAFDRPRHDLNGRAGREIHAYTEMFLRHHAAISTPQSQQAALSNKEREVLKFLIAGKSNKEIARKLGVSPNTVNTHIYRTFTKLNVKTRAQAALAAAKTDLALAS